MGLFENAGVRFERAKFPGVFGHGNGVVEGFGTAVSLCCEVLGVVCEVEIELLGSSTYCNVVLDCDVQTDNRSAMLGQFIAAIHKVVARYLAELRIRCLVDE
jgi:hypothetical protein